MNFTFIQAISTFALFLPFKKKGASTGINNHMKKFQWDRVCHVLKKVKHFNGVMILQPFSCPVKLVCYPKSQKALQTFSIFLVPISGKARYGAL